MVNTLALFYSSPPPPPPPPPSLSLSLPSLPPSFCILLYFSVCLHLSLSVVPSLSSSLCLYYYIYDLQAVFPPGLQGISLSSLNTPNDILNLMLWLSTAQCSLIMLISANSPQWLCWLFCLPNQKEILLFKPWNCFEAHVRASPHPKGSIHSNFLWLFS